MTTKPVDESKRNFLKFAGGVAVVGGFLLIAGKSIHHGAVKQVSTVARALPKVFKRLPSLPLDPALHIEGLSSLITPTTSFFQIDTAASVPIIDSSQWSLKISGMVKNPITLTYQELLARPLFELDNTLSCVSNPVGGELVGNARWLGARLDDLIRESDPDAGADQILASSDDGFSAGFPLNLLDGRDAMIAIGMNGSALPPKHGFPARLIVPGLYGYVSATKWVTRIELTTFKLKEGFWISRGWSTLAPVKMESRIDLPVEGSRIPPGKFTFAGVAWAPGDPADSVASVEVQIDGGPWLSATLGPELSSTTWRQWWLDHEVVAGSHVIVVRASSSKGQDQTSIRQNVAPNGAQGWHSVNFRV
jgi:DMSO/TMAO reductase YedYZ molybdopterin-dependent catalytic subunit